MKRAVEGRRSLVVGFTRGLLLPLLLALGTAFVPVATTSAATKADAPAEAKSGPAREKVKDACLKCHDDPATKTAEGKSMAPMGDLFNRSAHRKIDCGRCHATAFEVDHPKGGALGKVNPEGCKDCHEEEVAAITASQHGKKQGSDKAIKDCTGCHGSLHAVKKEGDPTSRMSPINQIEACGRCHQDVLEGYVVSEHARGVLKSGLTKNSPTCSSCHGKHDIGAKESPEALMHRAKQPATCGQCHEAVLRDWNASSHGQLYKTGKPGKEGVEAPVCADCHTAHAIKRTDSTAVRFEFADRCGKCHEKIDESFHDSFHGKAVALNNRKSAMCSDCHTPHANLPKSDPKSSVHPDNLAKTCGACHQGVTASFLTFDPHAQPSSPDRNKYLHWLYIGMTSLLVGVFGFFGLHGLLWLQRSIVGVMRGEFRDHHDKDGPWVRRFSGLQIGIHIAIMSSFLLLAISGLPLKFAQASWAPAMIAALGGASTAQFLHRVAGAITFGYFVVHVGSLLYGLMLRREHGYFWGPHSMVPQPRDVVDLWGMVKWFLYIGPRPQFDRFTYWEKFDYLAVFWGVMMIGLSGLMLWFPTFFSSFLPGWALNAAYLIHSDEALLATGFIFLFHFFHTHLRPEAFPMDTVVFLGRMPLAVMKAERLKEYDTLVAQGKLEERLGPKPTALEFRIAYIVGTIGLVLGLFCAAFIFRALIGALLK